MRRRTRFLLGAAAALLSQAAAAQQLAGNGGADVSLFRVVVALLLGIAATIAAALFLRGGSHGIRKGFFGLASSFRGDRRIEVIEARRITPGAELCLVACDGVEFLILCGQSSHQVLSQRSRTSGIDGRARE